MFRLNVREDTKRLSLYDVVASSTRTNAAFHKALQRYRLQEIGDFELPVVPN